MAEPDLELRLVDEASFDAIPDPIRPGARCRTCDYWERVDGSRDAPAPDARDAASRADLKRSRLLAGRALAGSYAMLAFRRDEADLAVAYAQFGPMSQYPRAQSIRDRYPQLPDSPAPWVVTCLQVPGAADAAERTRIGAALAGSYAMLAFRRDEPDLAVAYAQFGPMSQYPRAQSIRDRYPQLPDSPAPWVVTCLQVPCAADEGERKRIGAALLAGVRRELERRGIASVEAYPEGVAEPWLPSPGPAALYEADGWERAAGDDRFPVYRRELEGAGADIGWDDLLSRARPTASDDDWPLPTSTRRSEEDLFRLPEKPKRPNPFGDD